ncbi:tRNA pseudouridine(13) synthase TruD [Candidatus Woesearchaeota archaeon]|nr:tRNA pseudouridine(13) synthase TruD [Candidatus Woesearchaeota archaeon]
MYKIKQIPEDFIVKEIPKFELDDGGEYAYFMLIKKDYTTIKALQTISSKLNIPLKNIGFAGNKDKRAVTEQMISIRHIKPERIEKLNLKDITLKYIGQGSRPISLGDLKGNKFMITIRDLDSKKIRLRNPKNIINYFGPQRFSRNNAEIGKSLVKKNFKKAVELMDNKEVRYYVEDNPGDYVGALRKLPLKTRKIFIHAYQSYIWNKTVDEYSKTMPYKNESIPIMGFGTEIKNKDLRPMIRKIMMQQGITQRDFIIKQMPELSEEGSERNMYITPENFTAVPDKDELNKDRYKAILEFSLPKGSYATVIIEHIFNSN